MAFFISLFIFASNSMMQMDIPKYDLIEELKWRGMVQDIMPGTQDFLNQHITTGYIGFDPLPNHFISEV